MPVPDRDLLHAEMRAHHRREGRHRAALAAAEDGAERVGLLLVRALVHIGGKRPISIGHRAGRVRHHHYVQAVERGAVIVALVDMETPAARCTRPGSAARSAARPSRQGTDTPRRNCSSQEQPPVRRHFFPRHGAPPASFSLTIVHSPLAWREQSGDGFFLLAERNQRRFGRMGVGVGIGGAGRGGGGSLTPIDFIRES